MARRKVVWQKARRTKLDSHSEKASGNSRREREVQRCPSQLVSSDAMFSLAADFFDFFFDLAVSRPDSSNCHERDGRCRPHTCLYARMRTFLVHSTCVTDVSLALGSRLASVARFSKECHLSIMSFFSPICSLSRPLSFVNPFGWNQESPCVSARWSGMSGRVAKIQIQHVDSRSQLADTLTEFHL